MRPARLLLAGACTACLLLPSWGQDPLDPGVIDVSEIPDPQLEASLLTQKKARIIELKIPAPRGQITDRYGRPLAQTRVAHYPAIRFPVDGELAPPDALAYARERIDEVNTQLGSDYQVEDEAILRHYENRKYLPLTFGGVLNEASEKILRDLAREGLDLHAVYLRHYPNGAVAPHVIGRVQRTSGPPSGPIENGDLVFDHYGGVEGLEASYDDRLTGEDGSLSILFNNEGRKIREEVVRAPVQGHNVVTTLDIDLQRHAEQALRGSAHASALAVVDVKKGDILALASFPLFDPNDFIPSISQEKWESILNDRRKPLLPRAYQGHYHPASTFKVFMASAMLKTGKVSPTKEFRCPPFLRAGNRRFRNWTTSDMGAMSLRRAIMMSCNTYFFQIGDIVGSEDLIAESLRYGFGRPTGIPLEEYGGFIPTNAWLIENERGRSMTQGDIWNFVIGQGYTEATPLQVAQAMAGLANGKFVPHAHLIRQVQNASNQVLESFAPPPIGTLELKEEDLAVIHNGMVDCANAGGGTGRWGACSYATVAAKTGTAQWSQGRYLAWYAGFIPARNPRIAFAVVYEGNRGQGLSGGRNAGPIAKRFLNSVYGDKSQMFWTAGGQAAKSDEEKADEEEAAPAKKPTRRSRPRARQPAPVPKAQPAPQAAPQPQQERKRRGWLSRIFRR